MKEFFSNMKPFGQLMTLAVVFFMLFMVSMGIEVILAAVGIDVTSTYVLLLTQGLSQLLMFFVPACLCAWLFSDTVSSGLRLRFARSNWLHLLAALALLLLIMPFNDWVTRVNDNWHWSGALQPVEDALRVVASMSETLVSQFLALEGVGNLLLNVLVLALVPALCEEFFFRGGVQNICQRWFRGNVHWAVVCTAALFSLVHFDVFAFLPRFLLGLLLGYVYVYSGSIWVNVAVHFLNNLMVVLLTYLYNQGTLANNWADDISAPWWLIVPTLLVSGLLFWLVFVRNKKKDSLLQ
ncbi:MAG: CPBP family intramembrane metalloprotease [Bacteroidales bacterium]|nr:CPBP family intramembrane metalloprotease [Bacteroidales bacterium]